MRRKNILALSLAVVLVLSGCGNGADGRGDAEIPAGNEAGSEASGQNGGEGADSEALVSGEIFSDRDFETDYDESKSAVIELNGSSAKCDSDAVEISGSTVTIKDEGTYILSGSLDDGMIIVDSDKDDKTQLVLNGVNIHSKTSAPIYILQSDKVFITLAESTANSLSNGGSFVAIDDNEIDGVIFSKEDLTINGKGSLAISSPAGHGVVSKDEFAVTGGSYDIVCASHGLSGKDGVGIAEASFSIVSGKDGVHAENNDDSSLGYVYIQSGTFEIASEGDGISAESAMQIDDGTFHIEAGGGSENATGQTSEWGNFGGFGGFGGRGDKRPDANGEGMEPPADSVEARSFVDNADEAIESSTESDVTSFKGLKATSLTINGGTFNIDAADDGVHANGSIVINGGTFAIATGDDGFHADETLTIAAGTIDISESYEGLEGLHVKVTGGEISLVAGDDGLNAAGGMDSSGFGGMGGNDMFGGKGGRHGGGMQGGMPGSGSSDGSVTISGGNIYVKASGDGIDANGTLTITGGNTVICGPNWGDTATLDYDISAEISGGTFIGTGAMSMAQTFSDSEQGVVSVNAGNATAGTVVTLADKSGNELMTVTPEMDFSIVIFSTPELVSGETYTLTVGTDTAEFTAQ